MAEKNIGTIGQLFPPKPTWTAADVPDQTGKTVIVTGGNGGIGRETARVLLSKGARVYIATRSEEKSQKAIEELKKETGKDSIFFLKLDLADLVSIKATAEEYISKETELHTLYNNGGVMNSPIDHVTTQGFDMQFGTNVLGHFYLTKLLLPVLTATAKKTPAGTVRVVNVSSIAHQYGAPEGIRWATLAPGNDSLEARKELTSTKLYGQSKLGNILFSKELARRYGAGGIVSTSLHPGVIHTDLGRYSGSFLNWIGQMIGYDVSYGAITSLYAGTAPAAGELNGKYLTVWARVAVPSENALDAELGKKLWEWCEEQVKDI
ncbi:NAD(P)-binding protein [Lactarius akahatsu]|uniref:NAD(P)-binding protein n=1 Tax=Lactarius akahatsu TaxID=416441 RepID=A0AAD4QBD1_9AGAM|nr:NAD(P)-binding protein [Lactarius akahatsu]